MSNQFTTADLASHNDVATGLWIAIDGAVYAMADFVDEHPGGAKILKRVGGKDASKQFWKVRGLSFASLGRVVSVPCVDGRPTVSQ